MNDIEPGEDGFVPTLLLRVEEAALRLGIGRTSMYRLVMTGEVESVQIGVGGGRLRARIEHPPVDRLDVLRLEAVKAHAPDDRQQVLGDSCPGASHRQDGAR